MIIEHSRIGCTEYIFVESYQEFCNHYEVLEQKFLDKYFLSKNYIPNSFPCAFEVKEYDGHLFRYGFREYLKPYDITKAYHHIVDEWQLMVDRQQKRINEIKTFYKNFCETP